MPIRKFDEYEYKKSENRIKVEFLREASDRLNPWEITNFVSRISTYMYKIEVLNTVAMAINNGIEKKNIFILDKAYKLNGNYKYFSTIKLDSMELNSIYSIGKPIGLEPNDHLMEIRYLFEILYKVNQVLYQFGRRRINKWDRVEAYCVMKTQGFSAALSYVLEMAKGKLNNEDGIKANKKLASECEKVYKKYQAYLLDKRYFEGMEEKLERKNVEEFSEIEQRIEKDYFKKFYEYLFLLPRPVVGIYDECECKFHILCADHFDSSRNNHTKIDLKKVTQNSPILAEVEAGCQILALKKEEERRNEIHELEKKKLELEIEKLEKENKILDGNLIKNDMDIVIKSIDMKHRLNDMAESVENSGIKAMGNSYANQQLLLVYGKVQNGYSETLKTHKFAEKSTTIIDVKV